MISPLDELDVCLEIGKMNAGVLMADGTTVRPLLALVIHPESRAVLGSALSVENDLSQLIRNAIHDAFQGGSIFGKPLDLSSISRITISMSRESWLLAERLDHLQPCFEFRPNAGKAMTSGVVEKIMQRFTSSLTPSYQSPAVMKQPPAVFSLDDLSRFVFDMIAIYLRQMHAGTRQTPMQSWQAYRGEPSPCRGET